MPATVRTLDARHAGHERALRRRHLGLWVLAPVVLLVGGVCDHSGKIIPVVPEFDITDSFESGLGQWTSEAIDLGEPAGAWSAQGTTGEASAGTRSVELTLDNVGGAGKVWIERELEVAPGQAYDVEISFDLESADFGTFGLWTVIAGVSTAAPRAATELTFQDDTGNGSSVDGGYHWISKTYTVHGRSDEDGHLYVTIGVWGTSQAARTYYVDNVRLQLTRAG
jgi:hypothetical protein